MENTVAEVTRDVLVDEDISERDMRDIIELVRLQYLHSRGYENSTDKNVPVTVIAKVKIDR